MKQFLSLATQIIYEEVARKCQPIGAFWSKVKRPIVIISVCVVAILYPFATFAIAGLVFYLTVQVVSLCGFFIAYLTFMGMLIFGMMGLPGYLDKLTKLTSR